MIAHDPMRAAADRVAEQLRAAARDFLDGDARSANERRGEAARIYRRAMTDAANQFLDAGWTKALDDEKAARAAAKEA